jgi:hypothetical protein
MTIRWGLGGLGLRRDGLCVPRSLPECGRRGLRGGREEVVLVGVDGVADGLAPVVGAEGVGVFVLGEVDGLQKSLGQVGDGAGGSGFYIAADDCGDEASQGGAEIAGGEVVAGEEVGEVLAE